MANKKSVISQLQTVGEEALGKLAGNDVARSALQGAIKVKERAEKTLTGFEEVDKRLAAIEKRLSALEGKNKPASSSGTARKSAASTKSPAGAKPKSS
jgi:hypothetical protein